MNSRLGFAILVVLLSVQYYIVGVPYITRQYVYPFGYREVVESAARDYKVSSALVAAVILRESKFNEQAESEPGALGLMQLMPETAHWIVEQLNQPRMTDNDIKVPTTNIKLGTWYIAYLLDEFKGNKVLALAAYNAGRGHVEEWMHTYGWDYSFSDVKAIPFTETREYVKQVLEAEQAYIELY